MAVPKRQPPPISEPNNRKPNEQEVDIDDAAIEEPRDNVFEQIEPEE